MQRRGHVEAEQNQVVQADETAPETCTTQTTTNMTGTGESPKSLPTQTQPVARPQKEPEAPVSGNPRDVGQDGADCNADSMCAPNRESDQHEHGHAAVAAAAATSQLTREAGGDTRNISNGDRRGQEQDEGNTSGDHAADAAESYEHQHVHAVYESIASHFSSTRYKPWPMVSYFLGSQKSGSVGLDVGCGNGKYLPLAMAAAGAGAAAASRVDVEVAGGDYRPKEEKDPSWPHLFMIGCDRSANLVRLARDNNGSGGGGDGVEVKKDTNEVAVADGLDLPFPPGRADFAICIAVVHHLSTRTRRVEAVNKLLECVKPPVKGGEGGGGGQILVYVWALEQGDSRRGFDEGNTDQDLLVPWVLKEKKEQQTKQSGAAKKERSRKKKEEKKRLKKARQGRGEGGGEQEEDDDDNEDKAVKEGENREADADNPAAATTFVTPSTEQKSGHAEQPATEPAAPPPAPAAAAAEEKTYQRYYHLYRKGELEEDVVAAGGKVLNSGYERDNWWCIASRLT